MESDLWAQPEFGETGDDPMEDISEEVGDRLWYDAGISDRFSLPDFSFLKGCTHPAALAAARAFDLNN